MKYIPFKATISTPSVCDLAVNVIFIIFIIVTSCEYLKVDLSRRNIPFKKKKK